MIRPATAEDLDAIAALHRAARATYYRDRLPEDAYDGPSELARSRAAWATAVAEGRVLCAVRDGEIAGVAAHGVRDGVAHLGQLHVAPAHWRRGVGTELHRACVDAWRAGGVTTVRLDVYEHNTRAQAFYAAHGWEVDPDVPRASTHLVLRLTLAPSEEWDAARPR
ncbi:MULTISPECIES: GNAT family N-acetyltransferase [Streptomyces]|uniref:GNAT family N-acetyltransferase n=1 Tax=Streptomyces solicathayae TaxID=3081768 RepID=A0ABZ0M034_9ACTN|nr:GNAT family N-acetyltransferase [Streptomyces sp. HUAS YS2]WOX25118.1 GNAT family N-acetyltransferase [Streptomyces sp. HUAS YS2]